MEARGDYEVSFCPTFTENDSARKAAAGSGIPPIMRVSNRPVIEARGDYEVSFCPIFTENDSARKAAAGPEIPPIMRVSNRPVIAADNRIMG